MIRSAILAIAAGLALASPAGALDLSAWQSAHFRDNPLNGTMGNLRLAQVDPESAARIHRNDFVRTERALEVYETTGETQSQWLARHAWSEAPFETTLLGIRWERAELRRRIADRVDIMLQQGWIEEVRALRNAGVREDATAMMALGYREIAAHLRGELSRVELRERISTSIGRFAKRQGTWFNRDPEIRWMVPGPDLLERALPLVREALAGT